MTRPLKIRNWLAAQTGTRKPGHLSTACPTSAIAIGIGEPGDIRVAHSIGVMFRDGQLGRIGGGKTGLYYIAREVSDRKGMSKEDARRRRTERERARQRLLGVVSREEYNKQMAANRLAKQAATVARVQAKLADKRARTAAAVQIAAKPAAPRPMKFDGKVQPSVSARPVKQVAAITDISADIARWIAAGNDVEVLEPCTWSTRLRCEALA